MESLEDKVCLTATVAITDGTLLISGEADGPIEITTNEAQQLQVTDNGVLLGVFDGVVDLDIELDAVESAAPAAIDFSLFMDGALAEDPSIVECTLTDGSTSECYEITVVGTPVNHDVGPFCPTHITDGEEAGGLWLDGENSYVIDGEFFTQLAEIYGDELWNNIFNDDGSINVIDNAEDFQVAARPNITEEFYFHCVDGNIEWVGDGVQATKTIQVPVTPVATDAVTVEFAEGGHSDLGVTFNGAGLSGSADVTAILSSFTIAAFDDCGGHINPALGYHVHGTAGCSDVGEAPEGETAPFALAIDGHTVHAPYDDADDVELDACNGHTSDEYGYHYHANSIEQNATLTCLTGLAVEGQVGGGGPPGGGPPGGGPGGGGPPAAGEPDENLTIAPVSGDGEHSDDSTVVLDIGSYELNNANVDLGGGTNSFTFASGEVEGDLIYWGLDSDGSDSVIFQSSSTVEGNVILELGDGADTVELLGEIEGDTEVHGDGGDDTATVGVTGDLDGMLLLAMGDGTNSFTSHGEIGQVYYFGGASEDTITLSATSEVQSDARLSVGAGENQIDVLGSIDGTLTVVSASDEESVTIHDDASVGSIITLFGVEDDHGHDHGEEDGHSHGPDFNGNGTVDFDDFLALSSVFGQTVTDATAGIDLDGSGVIDFGDFLLLADAFGDALPIDITDAILTNFSGDCGDYVGSYTAEALDIQNQILFTSMVTITADETSCTVTSDSVPNHEFNDETAAFAGGAEGATITPTETISVVARNPEFADEITPITSGLRNAIFLNGVRLNINTAGCYRPNSPDAGDDGNTGIGCTTDDPWLLDALGSEQQFGVDEHNGHTQPGGLYHYHGSPNALFENEPTEDGSAVIGFAADGFPVYGSFFLDSDTGEVREAISGYTLIEGSRGERSATNPGGDHDGEYVDDWEFTDAGDLDECNGMTVNGQYGYYMTNSYPWGVSCLVGTPDDSFLLGGGGDGGGGGGGGPGGGGPPADGGAPVDGGPVDGGVPQAIVLPASDYAGDYTLADEEFGTMVTVTVSDDTRSIVTNSLPDHEVGDFPNNGNPNTITEQSGNFEFPVEGTFVGTPSFALSPGVAVNGVSFIPGTAETVTCDSGEVFRIEALQEIYNLGLDFNNAHVQPNGQYHYHGVSELLVEAYSTDEDLVHVGFAADGFFVYYSKSDAFESGYELSTEPRVGTDCVASRAAGGDAVDIAGSVPDGIYASDWVHTDNGDLDECNGVTIGGEYVYMLTDSYPYVGRCLMGEVAGGGGPGGGGPPPGGGGAPPAGEPVGAAAAATLVRSQDEDDEDVTEIDVDVLDLVVDDLMEALATG